MRLLLRLLNGIRALFRRGIADEELDAELHAFLETAVDEKMRSGMSREQATRAARLELGLVSVGGVKDRVRNVGWESTVESVARDVQYAVRTLRNAPGFASVAVLTLALGIGANTAIFGLIDALMLRQLPVRDPDQLVVLTRIQGGQSGEHFSYPQVNYLAGARRPVRGPVRVRGGYVPHRPIRCARDDRRRLGYRRVLPHAGYHADHRPPPWPRRRPSRRSAGGSHHRRVLVPKVCAWP